MKGLDVFRHMLRCFAFIWPDMIEIHLELIFPWKLSVRIKWGHCEF